MNRKLGIAINIAIILIIVGSYFFLPTLFGLFMLIGIGYLVFEVCRLPFK